jgi:hypothetical protein
LKHQKRGADRSHLIGAANYIVLITKGSDQLPAEQTEIDNLRANYQRLADVPVLIGDHRLKVEIITPKLDKTLDREQHDTIDVRIHARCYGTFLPVGQSDLDPIKLGKIIGRGLESRRRMLRRAFEAHVFNPARLRNEKLTDRAKLVFFPASIMLSFDASLASFVYDMRAANELSRQTALGMIDADQSDEAVLREREARRFDDKFLTQQPHGTPNPANNNNGDASKPAKRAAGRTQGGRRNRGGAAPGSGQGQEPRRRPRGKKQLLERAKELRMRGYTAKLREELEELVAAEEERRGLGPDDPVEETDD